LLEADVLQKYDDDWFLWRNVAMVDLKISTERWFSTKLSPGLSRVK